MKFLCVGYFDPAKMDLLSRSEVDGVMSECPAHMQTIYETGRVTLVAGVDNETKYLQRAGGNVNVLDGDPAKAQVRIGCVFIIEAVDMDEATRLASLHPTTQVAAGENLGWYTEVRPVHYFSEGNPDVS